MEEINELLSRIMVFDTTFKKQIVEKVAGSAPAIVAKLQRILEEVLIWQKQLLTKKMKEDPSFQARLLARKQEAEKAIVAAYREELSAEDQQKMKIIVSKIKSL